MNPIYKIWSMIPLPIALKSFQSLAEEYLAKGMVKDVTFSKATYQVLVHDLPRLDHESDGDEGWWVFLQLDQQGDLKDAFCQCGEGGESRPCIHQAAAFLSIYTTYAIPMHMRFERSLWNRLCMRSAKAMGLNDRILKKKAAGHYQIGSSEAPNFSIVGQSLEMKEKIDSLLYERPLESEETSIKFSGLDSDEIARWRQGNPSMKLSYELSFWSDLAKWLMQQQERQGELGCCLQLIADRGELPSFLEVNFHERDLIARWELTPGILSGIISTLNSVRANLKVHPLWQERLSTATFDDKEDCFLLQPKLSSEEYARKLGDMHPISFGKWAYIAGDGFYALPSEGEEHPLLQKSKISVEEGLEHYPLELKALLVDKEVETLPKALHYRLSFDESDSLHVDAYLFEPGDLASKECRCYGSYVYIDPKGFYRLQKRPFPSLHFSVAAADIPGFIVDNRLWLTKQKGFEIHSSPLGITLSYEVRKDHYLTFGGELARGPLNLDHESSVKEFGPWLYLESKGFFPKNAGNSAIGIAPQTSVSPSQIPTFIRQQRQELIALPGFFSARCPVAKVGLDIHLFRDEMIEIAPTHILLPEYQGKEVLFFEEFSYVAGEGFYDLSALITLPVGFQSSFIVNKSQLTNFLEQELPKIMPWVCHLDPRLQKPAKMLLVTNSIRAAKENRSHKDYFALELGYQVESKTITIASLWQALQQNKRYLFTASGLIDLQDKRFDWIRQLKKQHLNLKEEAIELSTLEVLRLNAQEEIALGEIRQDQQTSVVQEFFSLTSLQLDSEPNTTGLKSMLRPYQLIGVRWLWFLYSHSLSGLLCDDMGLGKTHQAMALLMAVSNLYRQENREEKPRFLVICPTSVIYHWQEKLEQYLPDMRVHTFYGVQRNLDAFASADILLTSYGIWRNEIDALHGLEFQVAIFDELQIAKNHLSRVYKALLKARARMFLGLTGTPIENQLRELKTLFDIILPSFMPQDRIYREFFIKPIEKQANEERKQLLGKLIKPFVLRRKKEEVLFDLPEKSEEIAHCELIGDQRDLYIKVLNDVRERLIADLSDEHAPIPYMHIFALLTHLKQICNHPAVYLKKPDEYAHYQSGKWELLLELLAEARESEQKVVIFSQYLGMLDIIENYLNSQHIGYASIRGKTQDRAKQLQKFKNDPKCEIFLASLQAAGLGVDLTAASVVIHYDRWWNSARERQATDRVHRIGQKRGVQVFKLLTLGTVEEHIDAIIERKQQLLEEVVGSDDHQVIKRFDRQEMIALLQAIPKG